MNYITAPGSKKADRRFRPMIGQKVIKEQVIDIVCEHFGVTFDDLARITRKRPVVSKRQILVYFLCHYTTETLVDIGIMFGKDHTTIIHSEEKISDLIDAKDAICADVDAIRQRILNLYY